MTSSRTTTKTTKTRPYTELLHKLVSLLDKSRIASARSINAIMTATYWQVGRHIIEFEQMGQLRASYVAQLLGRLSGDLTKRLGRGGSADNLETMRLFYQAYPKALSISETVSRKSDLQPLAERFPLSWSHYVCLVRRSRSPETLAFYGYEALRSGWSVRQLERQMSTLFYERTGLTAELLHTRRTLKYRTASSKIPHRVKQSKI